MCTHSAFGALPYGLWQPHSAVLERAAVRSRQHSAVRGSRATAPAVWRLRGRYVGHAPRSAVQNTNVGDAANATIASHAANATAATTVTNAINACSSVWSQWPVGVSSLL
ncbi:hypothetical protein GCM10023334_110830 [Nonomuraea thailandensis]